MKYRRLGQSDLEVSEISLGSWLTFGVGVEADAARACIDKAFDVGINFIDTANIYGRGAAERFLGEALAGREWPRSMPHRGREQDEPAATGLNLPHGFDREPERILWFAEGQPARPIGRRRRQGYIER